jgi:hypothetical protein
MLPKRKMPKLIIVIVSSTELRLGVLDANIRRTWPVTDTRPVMAMGARLGTLDDGADRGRMRDRAGWHLLYLE